MPFCPECNSETAESTKFCSQCGASMTENKKSSNTNTNANENEQLKANETSEEITVKQNGAETETQASVSGQPVLTLEPPIFDQPPRASVFEPPAAPKQDVTPPPNPPVGEQPPPYGSRYAVMGVGSYIGSTIVISIPVIGWIFCIVWAFAARNQNKRNYMRMILIFWLVVVVLTVGTVFFAIWFANKFGGDITRWFEDFINSINIL